MKLESKRAALFALAVATAGPVAAKDGDEACTYEAGKLACPAPVSLSLGAAPTTFLMTKIDRSGELRADGGKAETFRRSLERQRKKAEREMRRKLRAVRRAEDREARFTELTEQRIAFTRNYRLGLSAYYGNNWNKPGDNPDTGPDEADE